MSLSIQVIYVHAFRNNADGSEYGAED